MDDGYGRTKWQYWVCHSTFSGRVKRSEILLCFKIKSNFKLNLWYKNWSKTDFRTISQLIGRDWVKSDKPHIPVLRGRKLEISSNIRHCKILYVPKNQIVSWGQDIAGPQSCQNIVQSFNLSREMILTCSSFTKSPADGENVADVSCQFQQIKKM